MAESVAAQRVTWQAYTMLFIKGDGIFSGTQLQGQSGNMES